MKKALVLGVLALFAFSAANVNAQDRTNVKSAKNDAKKEVKAAKETQEVKEIKAAKGETKEFKSANSAKTATKDVNAQGQKKEKKFGKGTGTMKAGEAAVGTTTKAVSEPQAGKDGACCKAEKKECEKAAKADPTSKNAKSGYNNSVPPKPKKVTETSTVEANGKKDIK